jgi:hypothetical protein
MFLAHNCICTQCHQQKKNLINITEHNQKKLLRIYQAISASFVEIEKEKTLRTQMRMGFHEGGKKSA